MKDLAKKLLNTENLAIQVVLRNQIKELAKKLTFTTISKAMKDTGLSYLGSVNSSAKIVKNAKKNYDTYILYLAPHKISGHNTCAKASEGCISACLNTSGRVKMDIEDTILTARLLKTLLFYGNREFFNKWLFAEIESHRIKAEKKGHKFSVRLNGTSDLNPNLFKVDGVTALEKFKDTQFYDYTKIFNRMELSKIDNYHLTFSYSGENMNEVIQALHLGYNIAVPFLVGKNDALPETFLGHDVQDADETDLRFLDELRIAGLRVKITKDRKAIQHAVEKGFVIDVDNFDIRKVLIA